MVLNEVATSWQSPEGSSRLCNKFAVDVDLGSSVNAHDADLSLNTAQESAIRIKHRGEDPSFFCNPSVFQLIVPVKTTK